MDKETLSKLIDVIFDTAEAYFANRPLIVMFLNMAQAAVKDILLDKIVAQAKASGMTLKAGPDKPGGK